jgi:hypothetical protein
MFRIVIVILIDHSHKPRHLTYYNDTTCVRQKHDIRGEHKRALPQRSAKGLVHMNSTAYSTISGFRNKQQQMPHTYCSKLILQLCRGSGG